MAASAIGLAGDCPPGQHRNRDESRFCYPGCMTDGTLESMESTLRHWCDRTIQVTVDGPAGRCERTIDRPYARIGSHRSADVVLKGCPRRAFYLHATSRGLFCLPLVPP